MGVLNEKRCKRIISKKHEETIRNNCKNIIDGVNTILKFIKWHYPFGYTDIGVDCNTKDITELTEELEKHIKRAESEIRESRMYGLSYRTGRVLPDLPPLTP